MEDLSSTIDSLVDGTAKTRQKYPDAPRWKVLVKAEDLGEQSVIVHSPNARQAQTTAMAVTTLPLRGQLVSYDVVLFGSTDAEKQAAKIQDTDFVIDCEVCGKPVVINTRITERRVLVDGEWVEADPTFVPPKSVRHAGCHR